MLLSLQLARRPRFALTPLALCVAGVWHASGVSAQDTPLPPARLATTPLLREALPDPLRRQMPTFVDGASISGRTELDLRIEGDAMLRRGDTVIRADRIDYYQPDDQARASGNVRINRAGDRYEGTLLELKVDAFQGFFTEPRFRFLRNDAHGQASRIDFLDDQNAIIRKATYTTCQREPGPSWMPDWHMTADTLRIDQQEETGYATGAVLRFKGVPVLAVPAMSFPLSDKRKSGFLPPTFTVDNVSGITLTQPYYWNIAPNRDLTVSPTLMSKRGVDLGTEFRYLEPGYRGSLRMNYLPSDNLRGIDRWSYSVRHTDRLLQSQLPGGVGLNLELNRVSDNDYWRDFTNRSGVGLTQRLLNNDAALSWAQGPFSLRMRAQKWQTLQDVSSPITPPYDRLPQVVARYTQDRLPGGLRLSVEGDYTRFQAGNLLSGQSMAGPDAHRSVMVTQLSRPWRAPGFFFVPRVQLHARQYQFDTALTDGQRSAQVTVPTFSLDSGLVFERELGLFGRDLMQTLEPRAYYVYTPFRAQNFLPNYDSGANDFNFATIFSDNTYGGHDRIANNKLLTLGLISRLQDAGTGAELARVGVAQRLRLSDQLVTLPGEVPLNERLSDILVGGAVNWTPKWTTDATVQYNPKLGRSVRSTLGGRYNPTPYRLITAAYRFQRDQSEQLDIGWQWPINDLWGDRGQDLGPGRGQGGGRWYSVGRINTSLKERRVVDAIVGFEYDGCCWIGRAVLERLQTGTGSANVRLLFQIEFVGFARLGTNAMTPLKANIPRYQLLRDQAAAPSRFTQYD
jgi:LPS-assembly protein